MKRKSGSRPNSNRVASAHSLRLVLESRLLFDGAVVATADQVVDDKAAQDHSNQDSPDNPDASASDKSDIGAGNIPAAFHDFLQIDSANPKVELSPDFTAGTNQDTTLLVIDSRAENAQEILANPPANTQIKILDANRDGYQQIAELLQEREDTSDLRIMTGTVGGKPWLGSSQLANYISASNSENLMHWGDGLADDALITFHGEQALTGQTWLNNVHNLTGGNVAWTQDSAQLTVRPEPVEGNVNTVSTSEHPTTEKETQPSDNGNLEKALAAVSTDTTPAVTSLVFIDTNVKDYQTLLAGIDPKATVILLDPTKDGMEQIAQAVSKYNNIDAIHIISHGSAGQLYLGGTTLNTHSMTGEHADELAIIKASLSANADILIYGCNFGQGEVGLEATNLLARLTGADIADSTNNTGAAALGADWVLERQTGTIEAAIVVDERSQADFQGTLVNISIVANTAPVITAGPDSVNIGGTLTPKTSPPGNIVGSTALYANVSSIVSPGYTGNVDLKATVTSVAAFDVNDTLIFTRTGTVPRLTLDGGTNGSSLSVHWELVRAGTNIPVVASFSFAVFDLDGVSTSETIETVTASTGNGLTQYAVETSPASHLIVQNNGIQVKASGTQAESNTSVSAIQFSWNEVSSVDFVYTTTPNSGGRNFDMSGVSGTGFFTSASVTPLGLDLDGDNSTTLGNNYQTSYSIGGSSVGIIDGDPSFSLAPPAFDTGTVRLTNAQAGDQLVVGTLPTGITATVDTSVAGQITVNLTGDATPADYLSALKAISFNNSLGAPVLTDRNVQVSLADGPTSTNVPIATIKVTPNRPPVNTLPVYTGTEDTNVPLIGLIIADANAGAAEVFTVTLSVPLGSGTLTGTAPSGGTVTGFGTNSLVLTGTLANINARLGSATRPVYVPVADFNGPVTLTMVTRDNNATPISDTDTTTITLSPIVDTVVDNLTTNEETLVTTNVLTTAPGADNFENSASGSATFRQLSSVTQGANGTVTFLSDGTVNYTPNANFVGSDSFTYTVISGGVTEIGTVNVTVNPINDAPVNSLPASYTASVGSPTVLSGLSVSDPDSPTGTILASTTLTVSSGTLSATSGGGVTVTVLTAGSIRLNGTISAINAFLASTAPTYSAAAAGSFTLTMLTSDLGNTGTGNILTDTDVRTISATLASAPIVDLNSNPSVTVGTATSTSNLVTGGDFATNGATPTAPWVEGGGNTGLVTNNRWVWGSGPADNTTLSQAITVPPPSSSITASSATSTTVVSTVDAITSISFDFAWANNDNTGPDWDNVLNVTYNGVLYAKFTTAPGGTLDGSGLVGNWTYFNGASGPATTNSVADETNIVAMANILITLPAGIIQSGNLVFNYNNGPGGAGADDVAIDNVAVTSTKTTTTTTTNAATVDYNWTATYTENGPGVSVADTDSSVFDASDANMESATIKLTNAFAGDVLTVGTLPSGMLFNINTSVAGEITVTLTGTFTKAQYADAIEQITFSNTTDSPSTTPRVINVTVSDGVLTSNTAVATITVIPANDPPTLTVTASNNFTEDSGTVVGAIVATYTTADAEGSAVTVTLSDTVNYALDGAGNVTLTAAGLALVNAGTDLPAFTLTPNDGTVNGTAATVDPTVTPVNDPPTLTVTASNNFTEDSGTVVGAIVATYTTADAEGSAVTVTLSDTVNYALDGAGNVTLTAAGLALVNAGTDLPAFTLTPNDGTVNGTAATVDPTVTPANDPPTNQIPVTNPDGPIITKSNSSIKGNVLTNDIDRDGDKLNVTSYSIFGVPGVFVAGDNATIPGVGTLKINSNGSFTFRPNAGYSGPVPTVTYTVSDGKGGFSSTTLTFADVPRNAPTDGQGNIGALILPPNPTLPFSASGGQFFHDPEPNNGSHQTLQNSWYAQLPEDLYLFGSIKDQVVYELHSYNFSIPPGTFRHSNPNEKLEYEATLVDGSPLPNWIDFDPNLLKFSGKPPEGSTNIEIKVTAKDRAGHKVSATFKVIIQDDTDYSNTQGQQLSAMKPIDQMQIKSVLTSKPSFSEQINAAGKFTRLAESRKLLDSINRL